MIALIAFYLFAGLTIASAILVIFARNPVHSVLWLIVAFFNAAGLMLLVGAEFIAMLLVIVYVGAVAVLFLFVVMMLDINLEKLRKDFWSYLPVGGLVAALLVLEMGWILWSHYSDAGFQRGEPAPLAPEDSNTKQLGRLIYTVYVYPFEIAAVILLVAIVAAIALTLRHRKESKYIDPARQIEVRRNDRVRIVTMSSEKKQD